jgi:hypothetical protein
MRMTRPRYTILSLISVILVASLMLSLFATSRQQREKVAALRLAQADYQNAKSTREVAEAAVSECAAEIALAKPDADRAADADRRRWEEWMQAKQRTIARRRDAVASAKAYEQAKKAEYERLKPNGTWLLW